MAGQAHKQQHSLEALLRPHTKRRSCYGPPGQPSQWRNRRPADSLPRPC